MFQSFPMNIWISSDVNNSLRSIRFGLHVIDVNTLIDTEFDKQLALRIKSQTESFLHFYAWEILVLMFTTIHMLFEIANGLWDNRETDIENIEQTVTRLYQSQNSHLYDEN